MRAPTCSEIWDEIGFKRVHRESDDSWRHGSYISEVFLRECDSTYWLVQYRKSTDGEENGLRQGEADIDQVKPIERVVISYEVI